MKKPKQRTAAFLALVFTLSLLCFSGCGAGDQKDIQAEEERVTWIDSETPSSGYVAGIFQPSELSAKYVSRILSGNQNLFVVTLQNTFENGVTTSSATVYETTPAGEVVRMIDCDGMSGDFQSTPSGELWMLVTQETADKTGLSYTVYSLSSFTPQAIVAESFSGGALNWKVDDNCIYIIQSFVDREGCTLRIYNRDGSFMNSFDYQEQIFLYPSDTELFLSTWENDHLYVLDKADGSLKAVADIEDRIIRCIKNEKVYLSDETGAYCLNLATGEESVLFTWNSYGILRCDYLIPLNEGAFLVYSMMNQSSPYRLLSKSDAAFGETRTLIFAINDPDPYAENSVYSRYADCIQDFNSISSSYHVIVKNYGQCQNPQELLNTEIISGNGPDLVELTGFSSELLHSDDCADLVPFLENDPEIDESCFLPNVLKYMKTDGKLLSIIPSFYIDSLVCNTRSLSEQEIHTFYDLRPQMSGMESILQGSLNCNDFLKLSFAQENRSFSQEEIQSILEVYKVLPEKEVSSQIEDVMEGKQLFGFCRVASPLRFSSNQPDVGGLAENHFLFGNTITFPGLQIPGGFAPLIEPIQELVMLKSSEEKEGVWSFVKFILSDNYLIKPNSYGEYRYGIPITQSAFRAGIDGMLSWIDVYHVLQANGRGNDYRFTDDSDAELFRNLPNRVGGILRREDQIFTTISGIANECRAGKKSIEQAAEDIYGRLAIYQAEHN